MLQASPESIISTELLRIIGKQQPLIEWEGVFMEHYFDYAGLDGPHRVYFPTPRSLEVRLELFLRLGLGLSIWELGQGMTRLFDLL